MTSQPHRHSRTAPVSQPFRLPALPILLALALGLVAVRSPIAAAASAAPPTATAITTAIAIADCSPCVAVSESRLAAQRGGFDIGPGLQASFGIDRSVTINGQLVVHQSVHIPDLRQISAAQAAGLLNIISNTTLVSNGQGNALALPTGAGGGIVIQNSLDGQAIRSLTALNASSNSLQTLRGAALNATLRDALTAPLGPR